VKAAREAGEMLGRLVPDIKKTAELVTEISAACREQDIGGDQINQAIQQLDKVTQQNASASEEMSATSEELAAQSEQLQTSIAYFRIEKATDERRPHSAAASEDIDRPHVNKMSRHRLSRLPSKPKAPAIASRGPIRNGGPRSGNATPDGFALNLDHTTDDHHDADFVKY
jgi:methyl-accepting chemotaxis protein